MAEWDEFRTWIETITEPKGLSIWEPDPAKNETDEGVIRSGAPVRSRSLEFSQKVFERFAILADLSTIPTDAYPINEIDVKRIINIFNGRNIGDFNNVPIEIYTWPAHVGDWIFNQARILDNEFLHFPLFFNKPKRGRPNHDFSPNWKIATWFSLLWHLLLIWRRGNKNAKNKSDELVIYWLTGLRKFASTEVYHSDSAWGEPKQVMLGDPAPRLGKASAVPFPAGASAYLAHVRANSNTQSKVPNGLCDDWALWLLGRIDLCHIDQHSDPTKGPLKLQDIDLNSDGAPTGCSLVTDPNLNQVLNNNFGKMVNLIRGAYVNWQEKQRAKVSVDDLISRTDQKWLITQFELDIYEKLAKSAASNMFRHPIHHWFKYVRI